jgi:NAD(P)-dependent dehydrogenase (short-subunit alcohol dehydrogenase family)
MHPDHQDVRAIPECIGSQKFSVAHAGGSAGIGRAVALGLSDNGAIVTVLVRRKDRLDAVVKELPQVALRSRRQLQFCVCLLCLVSLVVCFCCVCSRAASFPQM